MNRRKLLSIASGSNVALIIGCVGNEQNGEETNDVQQEEKRFLSLYSVDENLEMLSFNIDFIEQELSERKMPRLHIAVENKGDEIVSWEQSGYDYAFPGISTEPPGLAIGYEDTVSHLVLDEPGCLRVIGIEKDSVIVETKLEPNEKIDDIYGVVGSESRLEGTCPSPGVYRSEWEYEEYGVWGFEIEVKSDRDP